MTTDHDGLLNCDRLDEWLGDRLPGRGAPLAAARIKTGTSNAMFYLERGTHRFVLRRPPATMVSPTAHDVRREHRILAALDHTAVPHAHPLLLCEDTDVIGAPFLIMEHVDGFIAREPLPEPFASDGEARASIAYAMIDSLAELALVDWRAIGLEGFGKPDGYLARQVGRWLGQLERYKSRELPHLNDVAQWLESHRPQTARTGIIHGDYQFLNLIFHHGAPARTAAIVDWEQSTIGDVLVDLGWVLGLWVEPGEDSPTALPGQAPLSALPHMPRRRALAERYAERTGSDLSHLAYYEALSLFKLACVIEGNYYRFKTGKSKDPIHGAFEWMVPALLARSWSIAQNGII